MRYSMARDHISFLHDVLKPGQVVIAGSYVMSNVDASCEWRSNDVDLWMRDDSFETVCQRLIDEGYRATWTYGGMAEKYVQLVTADTSGYTDEHKSAIRIAIAEHGGAFFQAMDDNNDDHIGAYGRMRRCIKSIATMSHPERRMGVQLIVVRDTIESAIAMFDIDVCRVVYDGKCVWRMSERGAKSARVTQECMDVQSPDEWARTIKRCHKYVERGYTFDWSGVVQHFRTGAFDRLYAIQSWNRAVLTKVYKNVCILRRRGVPYWTMEGGSVHLECGGAVIATIPATELMPACGRCMSGEMSCGSVCAECSRQHVATKLNELTGLFDALCQLDEASAKRVRRIGHELAMVRVPDVLAPIRAHVPAPFEARCDPAV